MVILVLKVLCWKVRSSLVNANTIVALRPQYCCLCRGPKCRLSTRCLERQSTTFRLPQENLFALSSVLGRSQSRRNTATNVYMLLGGNRISFQHLLENLAAGSKVSARPGTGTALGTLQHRRRRDSAGRVRHYFAHPKVGGGSRSLARSAGWTVPSYYALAVSVAGSGESRSRRAESSGSRTEHGTDGGRRSPGPERQGAGGILRAHRRQRSFGGRDPC